MLRRQELVATHAQLVAAGVAISTVTNRIQPSGPWQRLLPGVVLAHSGTATVRERILGALAYVGDGAVITGATALAQYGVRAAPREPTVRLLQPQTRQRSSYNYLAVSRTQRLPDRVMRRGLPLAPVARALVDACREMSNLDAVRELVAEVIQRGMCTLAELTVEVLSAARQRTALGREVLREMEAGVRSVVEAKTRSILERLGIRQPMWNADLFTSDGEFVARPDAFWEELAAAMELDSMRWHLGPRDYKRTQERQRRMTNLGILVLPVAPAFVLEDPHKFGQTVRDFLAQAARRQITADVVVRAPAMA
jgi:hypothetical protein